MSVGSNIKSLRIERGLTQDILARIMQVPRTALVQIENGKQKVYAHQLKRLALAFQISVDELIKEPTDQE